MNSRKLDSFCEKGIVGLVLAALVFSALATGAVRALEFAVVEWLVSAAALLWVVRIWLEPRHNRLLFPPVGVCLLLFLAYALFHYAQSDIEYTARREVLRLLVYALLFFVVLNNLHKSEWTQLTLYVLVFTGVAIAVYGIVQVIAGLEHVWHFARPKQYGGRGSGTFINPNHFAGFLGLLLPLCIASVLTGRISQPMRILLGYSALLLLGGIAVSMSRGGWISTSLTLAAVIGVLGWRKQFRLGGILLTCLALGLAGGFLLKSDFAQDRLRDASKPGAAGHIGSRIELWGAAAKVWQEEKLLGVGPGHFDHRFPAHRPERLQSRPVRVHNDYLNMLVDWGLVGMLLAGMMLGTMVSGIIKSWKYSQRTSGNLSAKTSNRSAFVLGSTAGLGSIALHSFVDFNLHIPSNAMLAATLAGLLAAYIRFATERYWVAVRLPMRLAVTAVVGGVSILLMSQALGQAREIARLNASQEAETFPEQVTELEQAMEVEPNNFETAALLGEVHRRRAGDAGAAVRRVELKKAAGWLNRAIALNPYDAYSHARLGMTLAQLGQAEKAGPYFAQAEKLDPNGYLTVANVGWHKMHIGEYGAAKRYFERVSPLDDPTKGLIAHRSEPIAQDLARHIRESYLPYINEQLANPE
ncbi:MAG: O-antigen ligase family protein [Verrucomicrobiota bacterium]|nr:O-antigen ligase family protein [Verrucomicrobiota bacterium]MDP7049917.1 O-antigen ligase family protein [Verrucomicrobiota bacterium]